MKGRVAGPTARPDGSNYFSIEGDEIVTVLQNPSERWEIQQVTKDRPTVTVDPGKAPETVHDFSCFPIQQRDFIFGALHVQPAIAACRYFAVWNAPLLIQPAPLDECAGVGAAKRTIAIINEAVIPEGFHGTRVLVQPKFTLTIRTFNIF